jgi:hypothetical protein
MKRFYALFITFLIIFFPGYCQENKTSPVRILFHGLVMDASSLEPIANSQILINRKFSSVSDTGGGFAFYVFRRDTVIFKSLGYKSAILNVSDTLTGSEFIAGVYMYVDTLSIGEVVIVPRLTNIRSELYNAGNKTPSTFDNARYNVAISAYQGRTTRNQLGDPATNYELLRQRQKVDAFERGGIPSDKILGISPFMLIPAAYLLIHGLPEKPAPLKPQITRQEVEQINKKYLENLRRRSEDKR